MKAKLIFLLITLFAVHSVMPWPVHSSAVHSLISSPIWSGQQGEKGEKSYRKLLKFSIESNDSFFNWKLDCHWGLFWNYVTRYLRNKKIDFFLEFLKESCIICHYWNCIISMIDQKSLHNLEIPPKLSPLPSFCFSCCAENENMNNSLHELEQKQQQKEGNH